MGVSEAFYIPAALALIADVHRGPTRSRAVGLHQMGIYLGVIVGGFGGYVADHPGLGWRWAFDACGIVGIAYAVPLFVLLGRAMPPRPSASGGSPAASMRPVAALRELLGNGSFLLLVLYFTLPALAGWVVRDWMPAILKAEFGIGQGLAGVSATLYWQLAAIVGAVGGGWLADRWMRRSPRGRDLRQRHRHGADRAGDVRRRLRAGTGQLWVAVAFLIAVRPRLGHSSTATTCRSSARSCGPSLRATGYGIMNLVSISCGGFADWGFGLLRDRHVPLFGIFGVFAERRGALRRCSSCSSARDETDPSPHDRLSARSTNSSPPPTRRSTPTARSPSRSCDAGAFLAANGVRTVFISGTTGECHSLTCDERLALSDAWASAGPAHGLAVIAHVGEQRHRGCAGAGAARPRRWASRRSARSRRRTSSPRTLDDLIDWCAAIAAAAPALPFYYYDIPSMTGVSFPIEQFLAEAPARIPTLAGVKFAQPRPGRRTGAASTRRPAASICPGAPTRRCSPRSRPVPAAAVGSTYNWAPPLYVGLRDAFDRGDLDEARRRQSLSIAMIDATGATGFMGTTKALMMRLGVPVGPARAAARQSVRGPGRCSGGPPGRARLRRVGRARRFDGSPRNT